MAFRSLIGILLMAALAAGCGARNEVAAPDEAAAPPLYGVGASVFGLPGGEARLASPPVAPLAGWLTPAAIPSPDGRYLAYNAWRELRRDDPKLSWADQGIHPGDPLATPSVRLFDSESGQDEVVAEGAFSLAWRADGAIAYFRGADRDYRAAVPYAGDIVVRKSVHARPAIWSRRTGRYIVVAWAGDRLVAYREREGEALDVVVFDAPRRMRVLARNASLVAIDPTGRSAFLARGPEAGIPAVEIRSIASGRKIARLDLGGANPAIGYVDYAGDWSGHRVVAATASGLALFRVGGTSIRLERIARVTSGTRVAEPRFASGGRVVAWTTSKSGSSFLDCRAGSCRTVRPLTRARGVHGFPVWRRPFYNPSRPLEGR